MKRTFIAIAAVLLLSGAGCRPARNDIANFEQCAAAGNPIMETWPRQCSANGKTFEEVIVVPPPGKESAFQYRSAFTLAAGETASFDDGLRVLLVKINDSRCKPDVQCIWAGELGATLSISIGDGDTQELRLAQTTEPNATALDRTFTLNAATETSATLTVTK